MNIRVECHQSHGGKIYPDRLSFCHGLGLSKTATANWMKVDNRFSNLNGSCESRWVLKYNGMLGLYLQTTNIIVLYLVIRDRQNLGTDKLASIHVAGNTASLLNSCKLILGVA